MSWLERHASSHGVQLVATAALSGAAVAAGILGYQALKRQEAVDKLKASIPDINDAYQRAESVGLSPNSSRRPRLGAFFADCEAKCS